MVLINPKYHWAVSCQMVAFLSLSLRICGLRKTPRVWNRALISRVGKGGPHLNNHSSLTCLLSAICHPSSVSRSLFRPPDGSKIPTYRYGYKSNIFSNFDYTS